MPRELLSELMTRAGALGAVLAAQQAAVETLEKALAERFDHHHLAPILRSAPGLGPILAAGSWPRSATTSAGSPPQPAYAPSPAPPRS